MSTHPALTRAGNAAAWIRDWKLWRLPPPAPWYICTLAAADVTALVTSGVFTSWRPGDAVLAAALIVCGALSVGATRQYDEPSGTLFWDMIPVWYQTIAIVLSPFYAIIAPACLIGYKQWRVMRSPWHRRVLSAAAIGIPYGLLSLVSTPYRLLPPGRSPPAAPTW